MLSESEFDAARFALQPGVHLIEASAGTGKTFAIGMLVLRAIVELQLPIDRILVVTFTKAATEELRGRIRARLSEYDLAGGFWATASPTSSRSAPTRPSMVSSIRRGSRPRAGSGSTWGCR